MAPTESEDRLVMGIDFGTTFSGVASSYSANTERPDDIQIISSWPGGSGATSEKVPSEMTYGQPPPSSSRTSANNTWNFSAMNSSLGDAVQPRWGFQLRADEPRLRCLKLLLESGQDIPSFVSKEEIEEQLRKVRKSAQDAVADYLTELYYHAKQVLVQRYGAFFIDTTRLDVILTVPAAWSDKAKGATLDAAKKAGVDGHVGMISEPEAAAVYALKAIQPNYLKKGDTFVVCDAGGGTVDLISYEILEVSPLRIREKISGTGACCGAAFLNMGFEELIRSKLGERVFQGLRQRKPRTLAQAMKYFEEYIKRNYDPAEGEDFDVPLPGVGDNRPVGLEAGFLMISSGDVAVLFEPIITQIIELIQGQIDSLSRQGVAARGILLVGGFGQNKCLFRRVQEQFADMIPPPSYSASASGTSEPEQRFEIMQPANAWTAVVRGAVLRGLEGAELVLSRKSRRNYGVTHQDDFNPDIHRVDEKFWSSSEDKYMVKNRLRWFIRKGQTCSSLEPILFNFYLLFLEGRRSKESSVWFCDDDYPPDVYDGSATGRVRKLCNLVTNLQDVPGHFWTPQTNKAGRLYEKLSFAYGMQIESGGLKFDLRVDDVVYGKVVADFSAE